MFLKKALINEIARKSIFQELNILKSNKIKRVDFIRFINLEVIDSTQLDLFKSLEKETNERWRYERNKR